MGRRQSRPALLELFQSRQEDSTRNPDEPELLSSWPKPGRSIRVTTGHLLLATAGVILLLVITWVIAFSQGELQARADLKSVIFRPVESDPLVVTPSAMPESNEIAVPVQGGLGFMGDPRQKGLFYFVLAETREAGALRLADFCRERGLETWVIPRDNTGLARVIALPGLTSTSRSEAACRDLDERIGGIGLQWVESGGQSSLEDRYLVRWDG